MDHHLKTQVEADLERKIASTGDDVRRTVLERARVFKSSWVDLGEILSLLARNQQYKAWGYKSLTEYCQKELHIREATVHKLVGNFNFLSSHEPKLLEQDNIVRLPDPESLRVLARAKEDKTLDDEAWSRLKEGAINHGYTAATLHRKIREAGAEPSGDQAPKEKESQTDAQIRQRIISLVSSIRILLEKKQDTPGEIREALTCLERFARTEDAGPNP
ncbi:MAG TPA: hypothetical protein PLM00_04675 [Spirochaetota bacterium]|nr:hypothetical protein [Spirochaetota bacterium]